MATWVAVGIAGLGVILAEILEGLRLFLRGDGAGRTHRWPASLSVGQYLVASVFRLALGGVVALSLAVLGLLCDESLAFLAGLSTLKVVEILFGYSPAA